MGLVDSNFSAVLSSYVDYVEQRYQQFSTVCIVFDGYFDKNSTKGNEHARRGAKMSSNVNVLIPGNTRETTLRENISSKPTQQSGIYFSSCAPS